MPFDPDKIIELIKIKGPIIPVQISKEISQNILFTSAMLSELVVKGRLKVSNTKVGGGSPLYYIPGQEAQLTRFVSNLNEKDRRTYLHLKEQGVLRDSDLDALTRFCLRQIKDFAIPLQVSTNGDKELFWKYFLLSAEQVEGMIKKKLGINEPRQEPAQPAVANTPELEAASQPAKTDELQKDAASLIPVEGASKYVQKKLEKIDATPRQDNFIQKIRGKRGPARKPDKFYEKVLAFFKDNNIQIVNEEYIRKGEYSFVLEVGSVVGVTTYLCNAKNKKRVDEGDISALFIKANARHLPSLLIASGAPTKSAKVLLEHELRGLNIKQI